MSSLGEEQLRLEEGRQRADEWGLVLSSQGIPSRVVLTEAGYSLRVREEDTVRAEAVLRVYEEENAEEIPAEEEAAAEPASRVVALVVVTAMGVFHTVTGPSRSDTLWFGVGGADAARIQAGELWRIVTALSLHVDLLHVAGNALLGGLLLAAVGRSLGPGLACAMVLAAGAGGNLANALLRGAAHFSIGASTAVFGSVGLFAGAGVVRRRRRGQRWRRALLPVAAGLGVLAMLGSGGGRVDAFAHLFGLAAGVLLGGVVGWLAPSAPAARAQWLWALAALVTLLGSWMRALASA